MSASGARLARALTSCVKSHCRLARADSLAHLGPNLCPGIPHQSDSFRRGTVGRGQVWRSHCSSALTFERCQRGCSVFCTRSTVRNTGGTKKPKVSEDEATVLTDGDRRPRIG